MNKPRFLSVAGVQSLHAASIAEFGGTLGLRDLATLESAVMHPRNIFYYNAGDLFDIAAAYAFHIAESQCFLDGNKRTAVAAALTFLVGNGVDPFYDQWKIYEILMRIAQRQATKADLAEYLREHNRPPGSP